MQDEQILFSHKMHNSRSYIHLLLPSVVQAQNLAYTS